MWKLLDKKMNIEKNPQELKPSLWSVIGLLIEGYNIPLSKSNFRTYQKFSSQNTSLQKGGE